MNIYSLHFFLQPMATALKGHPALGAWEIVNELEGSVYNGKVDPNKCFDTQVLIGSGAGWTGKWIPMYRLELYGTPL